MFDFERFSASALKYKYETALETESERISYAELSAEVNSLCNALLQMNTQKGAVAVLLRCAREALVTYYACSKAGFDCVCADSRISRVEASFLFEKYQPSVAVLPSCELTRLGDVFEGGGCKSMIFVGSEPEISPFPSQFSYTRLLKENDYAYVRRDKRTDAAHILFYGSFDDKIPQSIGEIPLREPIYTDLPVYESAGAHVFCALLESGRRCFISQSKSPKLFKKKKVKNIVCLDGVQQEYEEYSAVLHPIATDISKPYVCAYGGLFSPDRIAAYLTRRTGLAAACSYDVSKIRLIFEVNEIPRPGDRLITLLKKEASDLLYSANAPKSFVFKKTN